MHYLMKKIEELANYYGYDFIDYTGHPNYKNRKGKAYGLIDRRNRELACVYATKQQIKNYLLENQSRK